MRKIISRCAAALVLWAIPALGSQVGIVHTFSGEDGNGPNGQIATDGTRIFGTTDSGPAPGKGVIYSVKPDGSDFSLLHVFAGTPDGDFPESGLSLIGSTLFGTTSSGGAGNRGTLWSMNSDGSGYQVLHNFTGNTGDSRAPGASVIFAGSRLYGTTTVGGVNNTGTVYSIKPDGTDFQVLHSFGTGPADGTMPYARLTALGSRLYGTTDWDATVFSLNMDGSDFKVLHTFTTEISSTLLPVNGKLYGTTWAEGAYDSGTIFTINPDGSDFQVIHSFAGWPGPEFATTGLAFAGGRLYGTTWAGGEQAWGTLFSLNPDGSDFRLLHEFDPAFDAGLPSSELIQIGDQLYGGAWWTGPDDHGHVYSVSVPEPEAVGLLAIGIACCWRVRHRRGNSRGR